MMHMAPLPDLIPTSEVAAIFKVSEDTVRRWARTGKLAPVDYPGTEKRFRRDDIEAFFVKRPA